MDNGYTIRADPAHVLVSDDSGATADVLDAELRGDLRRWIDAATSLDLSHARPSAAAVASIAESRRIEPTATLIDPHAELAPGGSAERITLGPLAATNAFDDVLRARVSVRDVEPPTLADVASLMVSVGRVNGWDEAPDGYQRTYRPVPSAGGRHPIDLCLAAERVEGLRPGLWGFEPTRCELVRQGPVPESVWDGVSAALDYRTGQPAVILLIAQFERTLSRYPAGASLVWRDAGVVAATLHFHATAAGLRSTILGTAGLLPAGPGLRSDVGGVLIGR